MALKTTFHVKGIAACEVELVCADCNVNYSDAIEVEITGKYDIYSHRIDWNQETLQQTRDTLFPKGWTEQNQSKMFSGDAHFTEWTDWYCPECSTKRSE